jgi:hypothetical protein
LAKSIKLSEENIGIKIHDVGLGFYLRYDEKNRTSLTLNAFVLQDALPRK